MSTDSGLLGLEEGKEFAERYMVERALGCGGMGEVYLVKDRLLNNERLALKIMRADQSKDEIAIQRFTREVQLTRKVTHPNVVRTFEVGMHAGRLYFTMEYIEGRSLSDFLEGGAFSVTQALAVLEQVCLGLSAIHSLDIVHRDLKPGNIMVTPDATVKIADFGLARTEFSTLTMQCEVIGSIPYMAPEIWTGKEVGPHTDMYALGVVMYELLSGMWPFDGSSPGELMLKHLECSPVALCEMQQDVPTWLSDLVSRMLEKNPEDRPQSAEEILAVVERAQAHPTEDLADSKISKEALMQSVHSLNTRPSVPESLSSDDPLLVLPAPVEKKAKPEEELPELPLAEEPSHTLPLMVRGFAASSLAFAFYFFIGDLMGGYVKSFWHGMDPYAAWPALCGVLILCSFWLATLLALPNLVIFSFGFSLRSGLLNWGKTTLCFLTLLCLLSVFSTLNLKRNRSDIEMANNNSRIIAAGTMSAATLFDTLTFSPFQSDMRIQKSAGNTSVTTTRVRQGLSPAVAYLVLSLLAILIGSFFQQEAHRHDPSRQRSLQLYLPVLFFLPLILVEDLFLQRSLNLFNSDWFVPHQLHLGPFHLLLCRYSVMVTCINWLLLLGGFFAMSKLSVSDESARLEG